MRQSESCYYWVTGKFKKHKYINIRNAEINLQIDAILGYCLQGSPLRFHSIEESFRQKPFTLLLVFTS